MIEVGNATALEDIVAFAERMHFGNADDAREEYDVLLELAELARQIRSEIVGGAGPRTSTINQIRRGIDSFDAIRRNA